MLCNAVQPTHPVGPVPTRAYGMADGLGCDLVSHLPANGLRSSRSIIRHAEEMWKFSRTDESL